MRAPRALLVGLATLGLCAGVMPSAHADTTTDTYIVQLKSTVSASAVAPSLLGADAKILNHVHAAIAQLSAAKAAALASNPNVKSVRKNSRIAASGQETNAPWNLDLLDSRTGSTDTTYNYPSAGTGVTVYVIDSGLVPTHSEFAAANILPGKNYVQTSNPSTTCGNTLPADTTVNPTDTLDRLGHGTAVSSLIVGAKDGAAKAATIVPVRVLNCDGGGNSFDVVSAADWIIQQHLVAGGPSVVNMSFGAGEIARELDDATQALLDNGIVVVVAAGNSNMDACTSSPGAVPGAITAAAVTAGLAEAVWPDGQGTNFGRCVDLYAPGDQVVVADWQTANGSRLAEGTSFSAPLTAGAAAQVLAGHPTWTPAQVSADLSNRAAYGVVKGARSVNKLVNVSPPPPAGMVTSLSPTRLMDTRTGLGAVGPLTSGRTVTIPVAGITAPSTVSAVLVNITCTDATASGFITGYASGTPKPGVSNANFTAGKTGANLALIPVGADGAIALTAAVNGGTVQLVVDIQGFVTGGGNVTEPGAVKPVAPQRLADTRATGSVAGGGTLDVQVTAAVGVDANAAAVFLNVTVTSPGTPGFLTAYPTGEARPTTSNLNFVPGQTVPNMVLVKVGPNGVVSIFNASATAVHVIVDIQGFVKFGTPTSAGAVWPISPTRVMDTRVGVGAPPGAVVSGTTRTVQYTPPVGTASGVFMNLTVTETTASGFISAYPASGTRPTISNLNFDPGATVPNLASVGLTGSQATVFVAAGTYGSVQLVADVFAYIL